MGIVCHYLDQTSELMQNITLQQLSFKIIDVTSSTEAFVKEVADCKFILSSAMHGLICADSLGIPNKHIVLSDNVLGGEYKFRDYYSVFNNFTYRPVYLANTSIHDKDIDVFNKEYTIEASEVEQICRNLLDVAPFQVKNRS